MGKTKNDKLEKTADIEGGPSREADIKLEDSPKLEDSSIEEREKKLVAREQKLEDKLEEINQTQEAFRKEWDEKAEELDTLKDLAETPEEEEDEEEEIEKENLEVEESDEDKEKLGTEKNTENLFEKEIQREIQKEGIHREEVSSRLEDLDLKFEERELKDELNQALKKYPKMDRREVLFEIERNPSQNVLELAKTSHENVEAIEAKLREEIKSDLDKEAEGQKTEAEKTETLPSGPAGEPVTFPEERESVDPWEKASKDAKADMGM